MLKWFVFPRLPIDKNLGEFSKMFYYFTLWYQIFRIMWIVFWFVLYIFIFCSPQNSNSTHPLRYSYYFCNVIHKHTLCTMMYRILPWLICFVLQLREYQTRCIPRHATQLFIGGATIVWGYELNFCHNLTPTRV